MYCLILSNIAFQELQLTYKTLPKLEILTDSKLGDQILTTSFDTRYDQHIAIKTTLLF